MAYVHILKNESGEYYIGSTEDIKQHLHHYAGGYALSTHRMDGLKLAFSQEYPSVKIARAIELQLKRLKRHNYVEKIICDKKIKMGA